MIHQLNPTIEVIVTSKGNAEGVALAWIDYSTEHDIMWLVSIRETGECWTVPTWEIRLHRNWSFGYRNGEK